jgi:hypothetical protein
MSRKIAIIIAIENYLHLPTVAHADADARSVLSALERLGFDRSHIFINEEAKYNRLDNFFGTFGTQIKPDDTVYLFYAGHGYWKDANYLSCWDTEFTRIETTSLPLRKVIQGIQQAQVHKSVLFLDACHSGLQIGENEPLNHFSVEGIQSLIGSSDYFACFSSCKTTQKSYWDDEIEHGIWSHFLINALSGKVPELGDPTPLIVAHRLQEYLHKKVSEFAHALSLEQEPVLTSVQTEQFVIADLTNYLTKEAPIVVEAQSPKMFIFINESTTKVRWLSGFLSSHTVPRNVTGSTRTFVRKIAAEEIQAWTEEEYKRVRDVLKYSRSDLRHFPTEQDFGGEGFVKCPRFISKMSVDQSESSAKEAVTRLEVRIPRQHCHIILEEDFNQLLNRAYRILRLDFGEWTIDPELMIKTLEETAVDGLDFDYDPNASEISIELKTPDVRIRIQPDFLEVEATSGVRPKELFRQTTESLRFLKKSAILSVKLADSTSNQT